MNTQQSSLFNKRAFTAPIARLPRAQATNGDYQERYNSLVDFVRKNSSEKSPAPQLHTYLQKIQREEIRQQLVDAGLSRFDLSLLEARQLYKHLHPGESVTAAIAGWLPKYGFAMIAATSKRLLWLRVRPLFSVADDISYEMVAAVSYSSNKWYASVTLQTRIGDYSLNFVTLKAAQNFVNELESRALAS